MEFISQFIDIILSKTDKMTNNNIENSNVILDDFNSEQYEKDAIFPVIQEEAIVEKRVVETGKIIISKKISEREEIVDIPLFQEKVDVERVSINQVIQERPTVRQDGEVMIIPVVEEQVFYQKRLVLVEELHVRKQVVQTHQPQKITLSKEDVEIKRSTENQIPVDSNLQTK
jgi:uncharacterized protein (TIGR02271 family)